MKAGKGTRSIGTVEWARLGVLGLLLVVIASLVVVYGG